MIDGNCVNSGEINKFKINYALKAVKIQNNYSLQNEGDISQCLRRSTYKKVAISFQRKEGELRERTIERLKQRWSL